MALGDFWVIYWGRRICGDVITRNSHWFLRNKHRNMCSKYVWLTTDILSTNSFFVFENYCDQKFEDAIAMESIRSSGPVCLIPPHQPGTQMNILIDVVDMRNVILCRKILFGHWQRTNQIKCHIFTDAVLMTKVVIALQCVCIKKIDRVQFQLPGHNAWIILGMGSANLRRHYYGTSSLIGWTHTQNDPLRCSERSMNMHPFVYVFPL